jgi:hypothetical protein
MFAKDFSNKFAEQNRCKKLSLYASSYRWIFITPGLTSLSRDELDSIHYATLQILRGNEIRKDESKTGIQDLKGERYV